MYQYDRSNIQIPRQLSCPDSAGRADIGGACVESSRRKMTAATRPAPVSAAPSHRGGCQPASYRDRCGLAAAPMAGRGAHRRSEEHTSELQSRLHLVCRLLLEKKKKSDLTEGHLTQHQL